MTNQQILEKAIKKAIDGGWQGVTYEKDFDGEPIYHPEGSTLLRWDWNDNKNIFEDGMYEQYESINLEAIIFNHDFAKALWPNEMRQAPCPQRKQGCLVLHYASYPVWEDHLMQMVIADDPIKYLGDNL